MRVRITKRDYLYIVQTYVLKASANCTEIGFNSHFCELLVVMVLYLIVTQLCILVL